MQSGMSPNPEQKIISEPGASAIYPAPENVPVSSSRAEETDETKAVRILKLITIFAFGGTERQVVNLATKLDRSRFRLEMACLKKRGHFLNEIEQHHIPIREFPITRLYNPGTFAQQVRLAAHIKRQKIQIVHSYNFYANVFALPAARLAGVPVTIASIRDRGVYLTPAKTRMQKYLCNYSDCVLVNAESIKEWLIEEGYQPDKITVIRNGIDLSRYGNKPKDVSLHREFGLPETSPLIMMASRLNPQKGVEDLLRAAAIVTNRCPEARFLIVGEKQQDGNIVLAADKEFAHKMEQLVVDLGLSRHVIFTGYRSNVPEILAQATVSVLPSHSEGLSNSLLEAMASGIPVVATRVGGNPELVKDGETGLLVPPHDPDALAQAICTLLQNRDLAKTFGMRARRRAELDFSLERMVGDTQELYLKLLERHKRSKRLSF